jgi:hypothetical protein
VVPIPDHVKDCDVTQHSLSSYDQEDNGHD